MRILTLTSLFPNCEQPTLGVFVKERMKAVGERAHVRVVAPVPWAPPAPRPERYRMYARIPRREVVDGLDVDHPRFLAVPKAGRWFHGLTYAAGAGGAVRRRLRGDGFDLLDVHFAYPDGVAGALLANRLRRPLVITVRGTDVNDFPRDVVLRAWIRFALKRAALVIGVSQALADHVVKLGVAPQRVVAIGNGVDTCKFRPLDQQTARRELGLPLHGRVVLSVGNMIERKGFHHLVDAARQLRDRGQLDGVQFVFVGGPLDSANMYASAVRRQIEEHQLWGHIMLAGAQPHDQLYKWYSAADVSCLASSREGWPNVVMEAKACGTPVVATKVWGTPEALPNEADGLLVEEQSGPALAGAISRALSRQWNREAIVRHAQERTWDKVAAAVLERFEAVLSTHADGAQRA